MKIIEPSYEILDCPDGEECLAKLERIARVAYKSEDKIHGTWVECLDCRGFGYLLDPDGPIGLMPEHPNGTCKPCPTCKGAKGIKYDEPSSHKLIRRILRTDRREKLIKMTEEYCTDWLTNYEDPTAEDVHQSSAHIVDAILSAIRDNPPHESVIEHESITVVFTSNRGFTHELVRHRLAAFTQESTRYCNYSQGKFGSEITVTPKRDEASMGDDPSALLEAWYASLGEAERFYMILLNGGVKPEIARDLLPQALKAEIVITANLREWRHILKLRTSPRAHPDMRALMKPLLEELRKRIPIIFEELL